MRANVIAKDLRTPKYRTRIVVSKKVYNRKRNKKCLPFLLKPV